MEILICNHYDVCVIGAGPAGIFAALSAKQSVPDARILIIEKKSSPCTKLLITGGGRCNITNSYVSPKDYHTGSPNIVNSILSSFSNTATVDYFRKLGLDIVYEESGKAYPSSYKAETVRSTLLQIVDDNDIQVLCDYSAVSVNMDNESRWVITLANNIHLCTRCVIVATGGLSFPATGSDGQFFRYLCEDKRFESITPVPALVALKLRREGFWSTYHRYAGITFVGSLSLKKNTTTVLRSHGDILITHTGVSGPCVFDISGTVLRHIENPEYTIQLSMSDFCNEADAYKWLVAKRNEFPQRSARTILHEILPERLTTLFTQSDENLSAFRKEDLHSLALKLSDTRLFVNSNLDWEHAEVTSGGICLNQLNPKTLESKRDKGMFFCGEILDVDGRVGGFNLQWAWSSGWIAGRSVSKYLK